ncbi:DUF4827 family protein [Porphyromonas cangingivalis]|uniref:DUF4827 family protein n=1 Tax=Porphyromonas cangingivalis TaxID=36874 RepID=UPI0009DE814C|nr:DUF4827 family protein [Porphyromonas cangingivalis]
MNINRLYILTSLVTLAVALLFTSCEKKRISYTDMIKRENKEVSEFMSKNSMRVVEDFPEGLVTPENVFVKVLEGVYIRVINPGNNTKPISGKTRVSARFLVKSISDRRKFEADIISPQSGGTHPLRFIYRENREHLTPDPQASENEATNNRFLCGAMLQSLKYLGDGAVIQMITTFREGPSFAAEEGIPMYFERLQYQFIK